MIDTTLSGLAERICEVICNRFGVSPTEGYEIADEILDGLEERETMNTLYKYGMRLRGFSIGCQPRGVYKRVDDETGKYHDIIIYARKLTDKEVNDYELDYLGESDEEDQ